MHISATAFGGGVSEILYTLVPLMRDVGLDCEWQVIYGREEFFNATKLMHNALQGAPQDLDEEQWATWRRYNEMNATRALRRLGRVPDPRPAAGGAVQARAREGQGLGVALPHRPLDAQPGHDRPAAALHRRTTRSRCSTCATTCPQGMNGNVNVVPPAIDPLTPKNMALSPEDGVVRVRPVRDRHRPAADVPGLALRPLEGPARRDRRLPSGQGGDARGAARAGRLDGQRRPGGLGLLQRDRSPTPTATRTSTSSTTSTTSARSRSTPSSPTPTC